MFFSYVFGEDFLPAWLSIDDIFEPESAPPKRKFCWHMDEGNSWQLGFIVRISAQPFEVPDFLAKLVERKRFPHEIIGTNEFGNMLEIWEQVHADGSKTQHGTTNVQFPGGPHLLTTLMEADWGMGTVDQRLLGSCPNNNWQVSYRKKRPLKDIRNQGHWYCSYSINDKVMSDENYMEIIEGEAEAKSLHGPVHWADAGRFAGMQHRRTAILLYRPRPFENWKLTSLALTLIYPKHYGNEVDELWLGDKRVEGWEGESADVCDIFVKDGPMYIAFRPLVSPWRKDIDGPEPLTSDVRLKAEQRGLWGMVNIFNYRGPAVAVRDECDLARIGNGVVVEVATEKDFEDFDAFRNWFAKGQVVDDTFHWQRNVRYHRDALAGQPKLDMALRWDAWQDRIVSRAVNGRSLPEPQFQCTGIDNRKLPWLTGDVSGHDNFSWLAKLVSRPQHKHGHQPLPIKIEKE
jgi:hypothetical protein